MCSSTDEWISRECSGSSRSNTTKSEISAKIDNLIHTPNHSATAVVGMSSRDVQSGLTDQGSSSYGDARALYSQSGSVNGAGGTSATNKRQSFVEVVKQKNADKHTLLQIQEASHKDG